LATFGVPLEIKKFIYENIETVGHLEVLCTFLNHPGRKWDAESLQKELRSHITIAGKQLRHLESKGLIKEESDGLFIFFPDSELKAELVTILFDLYRSAPTAIITIIYDKPTDALKVFADAFKLKKD
jgi:hypothetical protein